MTATNPNQSVIQREYFRVTSDFSDEAGNQLPFASAATFATQHFLRVIDDTPENRAMEVGPALDNGHLVNATQIFEPYDPNKDAEKAGSYQEIEEYRLGEETVVLEGNADMKWFRGLRKVLVIRGVMPVPDGKRIEITADKEIVMPNGEKVPASTVLKVGRVIAVHVEGKGESEEVVVELVNNSPIIVKPKTLDAKTGGDDSLLE